MTELPSQTETPTPPEVPFAEPVGPSSAGLFPSPEAVMACPQCNAPVTSADRSYCMECGLIIPAADQSTTRDESGGTPEVIGGRYRLMALMSERGNVARYQGTDIGTPDTPFPVVIVRQKLPAARNTTDERTHPLTSESEHDFELPDNEEDQTTDELSELSGPPNEWPSTAWEQSVVVKASHLSLPRLIDAFAENGFHYLVEEVPTGIPLWDAWDRPGINWKMRCTWLLQIAEALQRLHRVGAIVEELRPDQLVVTGGDQAVLCDLDRLLPMPLPENAALRGLPGTAPELLLQPESATEQADLYAFGAMLYALLMGRELTELDFTLTGMPRAYLERDPDLNPFLARVISKTFVREAERRFPTEDGHLSDPTGFSELISALESCRRNMDRVRLDVSSWSTTGMVRSGNEDAVAVLHSHEGRLDDGDEFALIVLADGMGGMESGEVAAALAIQTLRQRMLSFPPFSGFVGRSVPTAAKAPAILERPRVLRDDPFALDTNNLKTLVVPPSRFPAESLMVRTTDRDSVARGSEVHRERILESLIEANRTVYDASRNGHGARGMGCTAEVVLIDGDQAVIGHVGDSRVYHLSRNRLAQVSRDQTLVNRLVELGHITPAEAETHPRRAELQQAIGGRSEVQPESYVLTLHPGDWLLVCSDGLSNQLSPAAIEATLRDSPTAERAARRLVNLAMLEGALDNVTVAVVHAR